MEKKPMVEVAPLKGEEMEGAGEVAGVSSPGVPLLPRRVSKLGDVEVPEKAVRRRYPAAYKLRILKEAEGCKERGQCSALLRREGPIRKPSQ
jgi:transposase